MKSLYEASNSLEAHMILNLLEQEGLSGRIDGEYLQGGLGELPATTVRVMIEESDYTSGKKITDEWVTKQPLEPAKIPTKKFGFGSALIGLITGIIIVIAYYRLPINELGIDHNDDGQLDEIWGISKTSVDRNFDGKIDFVLFFNRKGAPEHSSSDEDFNGTFETSAKYLNGNMVLSESDTRGIGFSDHIVNYKYGVIESETFFDIYTHKLVKINQYNSFKMTKSGIDTDNDGTLDTIYEYDSIGEITKKYDKN
jgi:Putative prokaryotic signal transducing protein